MRPPCVLRCLYPPLWVLRFETLCDYFPRGTALAALRTCKSGVLVGCAREQEAAAAAAHPDDKWLVGGLYGMVSLKPAA